MKPDKHLFELLEAFLKFDPNSMTPRIIAWYQGAIDSCLDCGALPGRKDHANK